MHQSSLLGCLFAFNSGNISRCAVNCSTSGDETYLDKHATILLSEVPMQTKQQCTVCYHTCTFVQNIFPLCILNDQFYNNSFHNVLLVADPRSKLQHKAFLFIISVPFSFLNFCPLRFFKFLSP
jgi:hypothetical protein